MTLISRRIFLGGLAAGTVLATRQSSGVAAPRLSFSETDEAYAWTPALNGWLEVDRAGFAANIATIRHQLAASVELCVVLKADAYGHGIGLLMPAVIAQRVAVIGITSNDEAQVARARGFTGKVVRIRTAGIDEITAGFALDLEESIGNLDLLRQVAAEARRLGRRLPVHFKLNSGGMSRNGMDLSTDQGRKDALAFVRTEGIEIAGLMTHFPVEAAEDCCDGAARFKAHCDWLIEAAGLDRRRLVLHAANSFATVNVPAAHFDMVRPGQALYGVLHGASADLGKVLSFKSRVAALDAYPKGNTVSYDRTVTLERNSLLANIPVGYSDGYSRRFSNKADVLVRGQRAPVMGRVTMNTIMVDVTDIPGVVAGDEVVLFGRQGQQEVSQADIESWTDNFLPAETTVWGNSLPKVLKR
jgi:alanine racemase